MRLLLFLYCSVCFAACSDADRFRPALQRQIDLLSKEKEIPYKDAAMVAYLQDSCSKEELLKLVNHSTPIVRILAYRAIVNREEADFFAILTRHLSDTAKVTWWYYDDVVGDCTVADLMVRKAEPHLTRPQKDTLIDLVLRGHLYLETAQWMMVDMLADERYYTIIKQQAEMPSDNCHDLGLTLAIAKFKKPSDVPFIRAKFSVLTDNPYCNDNIFRGIELLPDSSFFTILQRYFTEYVKGQKQSSYSDLEVYCRAVAQYKTQSALDILVALTKGSTYPDDWYLPHNKAYVFKAIHRYNCVLYKDLYDQLRPQMDKDFFKSMDISLSDRPSTW
jgi:hypothetical protein